MPTLQPETSISNFSQVPHESELHIDSQNLNIHSFAEQIGLETLEPDNRIELIEHATTADFIAVATMIHQMVAPEGDLSPIDVTSYTTSTDGENRNPLAAPDERLPIFDKTVSLAHELIQKYRVEGGDQTNLLERLSNLAGFSIVLAHPFKDGNGRTARTLGALIKEGYNPETIETVSKNRPPEGFRVNSYAPTELAMSQGSLVFLEQLAALEIPFKTSPYRDRQRGYYITPFGW